MYKFEFPIKEWFTRFSSADRKKLRIKDEVPVLLNLGKNMAYGEYLQESIEEAERLLGYKLPYLNVYRNDI